MNVKWVYIDSTFAMYILHIGLNVYWNGALSTTLVKHDTEKLHFAAIQRDIIYLIWYILPRK